MSWLCELVQKQFLEVSASFVKEGLVFGSRSGLPASHNGLKALV